MTSINMLLGEKSRSLASAMTPKLENKAFSAKSTQHKHLECRKEPYTCTCTIALWTHKRGT